jgi:hypothetical protein
MARPSPFEICCDSKSIVSSGATPSEVENRILKTKMTQMNLDDYYYIRQLMIRQPEKNNNTIQNVELTVPN